MIVLGLVGAPAGGKSTVARRLAELGATWIDADTIARGVLERREVQRELIGHFGAEITGGDARIDRGKLAAAVFGDDASNRDALTYLESVIHPPTRVEIRRQLVRAAEQRVSVGVLDVPLLFESAWDRACDQIWCVDAPMEQRVRWGEARGWQRSELVRRERFQLPIVEKQRLSNVCLENRGTLRELTDHAKQLYERLVAADEAPQLAPGHCVTD